MSSLARFRRTLSPQNENVRFEQSRNVRFHGWSGAPWRRSYRFEPARTGALDGAARDSQRTAIPKLERILFPNVPKFEEGPPLIHSKGWLGGLDSNQDSQIQSLESYQLDDLPAVEKRVLKLHHGPHRWSNG